MKTKFVLLLIIVCFLAGCATQAEEPTPTISFLTLPPTFTLEPSPTKLPTATPTLIQTQPPTQTFTPQPTQTFIPTPYVYLGTSLPEPAQQIAKENLHQLELVAQWGKGLLQMVAFSPNGESFAAASQYGVAIYQIARPSETPMWIPFGKFFDFDNFYFSIDGKYLAIQGDSIKYIHVASRQLVEDAQYAKWPEILPKSTGYYGEAVATSPDGSKVFKGGLSQISPERFYEKYGYERFTNEDVYKTVYDTTSGEVLYKLNDEAIYITIDQRTERESCDLANFSPCENAVMDLAAAPKNAAFSNDGKYLAVRYASESNSFGTLRIYQAENGSLISAIGTFDNQVRDFAFSPDSNRILVGFMNGSIHLWDIENDRSTFGVQHFNTRIYDYSYSHDGRFLLVLRSSRLEVRSTKDGNLIASYNATAYALSPTENYIAYGDLDGIIRMRDIASGEIIRRFQGHTGKILALAFSDNGNFLASSSEDCSTRLWNARTGQFIHPMQVNTVKHEAGSNIRIFIRHLEFLPDSPLIMGIGSFNTAVSWNRNTGRTGLLIGPTPLDFHMGMITIDPDYLGTYAVDRTNHQLILDNTSYDLETGEITEYYPTQQDTPEDCHSSGPISNDGRLRFTLGYNDREGIICVLDVDTSDLITTISIAPTIRWGYSNILWPFLSPDGTQLIVPTNDGVIFVYQIKD